MHTALPENQDIKSHLPSPFLNFKFFEQIYLQFDGQPELLEFKQENHKSSTFTCQHPEVLQPLIKAKSKSNLKEEKEEDGCSAKKKLNRDDLLDHRQSLFLSTQFQEILPAILTWRVVLE